MVDLNMLKLKLFLFIIQYIATSCDLEPAGFVI